jgi:hypothetical protein
MGADPIPFVPGPGGGSDPVENLESFIEFLSGVNGRLSSWQESLATLGLELEGRADTAESTLTHYREQLDHFEDELQASGQATVAAIRHLAEQADAVAGTELPAATAQIVHLDSAIEAQASKAQNELETDSDALNQQGYEVVKAACDGAEQTVTDAQTALEAGFHTFEQELEDTTRLVETTAASSVGDIDQETQELDAAAQAFSVAAVDATKVWLTELPALVNDAVAEHKRSVQEVYQAFDEAELAGFAEFETALGKVITAAERVLEEGHNELQKSVKEAQDQLQRQDDESKEIAEVAEGGAASLSGLDDGSLVSHLDTALDLLGTIDKLLQAM